MKRASVTEAKNRLSALLDRVRHGETVLIEDRGVPIAQLSPVLASSTGADGDRLTRLERQGIVTPARSARVSRRLLTAPPRPRKRVALSAMVLADRRSGW
jgi:prevent-host-death family protein